MRILLNRYDHDDKQTIGRFNLLENNKIIHAWDSLELPWKDNKRRVSCIPTGEYVAIKHRSPRFGQSLWLQDVPNRSEILVHRGNYHKDVLGCILIGTDLKDMNKDGYLDVKNSGTAIKELLSYLKNINRIDIEIVNSN